MGSDIGHAETGDERILLLDDRVHSRADQQRRGQVEDLVEDGIERGQDHRAAMRTGVAPETDEGVGFFCVGHGGIMPRFLNRSMC